MKVDNGKSDTIQNYICCMISQIQLKYLSETIVEEWRDQTEDIQTRQH
jgi:hypothetical protein